MRSKDTHTDIATYRLDYHRSPLSESAKKDGSYGCQRRLNKYDYKVIEGGAQLVFFLSSKHDANTFWVAVDINIFMFCHGVASASCDWT